MSLYTKAKALREERQKIYEEARQLQKLIAKEERGFTSDEQEKWDKLQAAIDERTKQIEEVEALITQHEDRGERLDSLIDQISQPPVYTPPDADERHDDADKASRVGRDQAVRAWLRGGMSALSPELRSRLNTDRPSDVPVMGPCLNVRYMSEAERRALSSGTDSTGGYTVDSQLAPSIVETMAQFGGMLQAAEVIDTDTGGDLTFVTNDDTSNVGALLSENTQVSEQDMTFGVVTLSAFTYTSKLVRVSYQLLQDSSYDIEGYLGRKLGERIGRAINAAFTTGDGSSKPNGIVTAASVGKTAASASALTFSELLDLKHSVDPAYRVNGTWMLSDSTLKEIKQLSVGNSDARPLWQPSPVVGEPDTIDGDRYIINQDMASISASAKPIIYGDLRAYKIRRVRDITLVRMNERYADYLQVGFLAYVRVDGDLVDTSAVKVYQMASA